MLIARQWRIRKKKDTNKFSVYVSNNLEEKKHVIVITTEF